MKKSLDYLRSNLKSNETVICATSGGVDSMVLLNLLILLKDEMKLNIVCAHVNHKLREESEEEYNFVENFCLKNNIIFEGFIIDKYEKGNIESQARKKRYHFFENLIDKYSAKYLLTAHHGDDLIETILMKLTRGASLESVKGFDYNCNFDRYKLIRPLVFYTKDDILNYSKENNIEFRDDKTNYDSSYTRNRYRKKVLPFLKKESTDVHLKYLKFSEEMKETNDFINEYVEKSFNLIVKNKSIDINLIKKENDFIIKKIIYLYLKQIYKDNIYLIEQKHINEVLKIVKSSKPNLSIDLPLNKTIIKKYDNLELKNVSQIDNYKYEIKDEIIILPYGRLKKLKKSTLTDNNICYLYSGDVKLPLYVRNKVEGDKITLLGSNSTKKIKDIFINKSIIISIFNGRGNNIISLLRSNKIFFLNRDIYCNHIVLSLLVSQSIFKLYHKI